MALLPGSQSVSVLAASLAILAVFLQPAGAYDSLDPYGNVAIKWDIISWTGDGYTAAVSLYNNQQFRGIQSYELGWQWAKKEIIYMTIGARATEQGDCTGYPYPPPHSCVRAPTIIDLVPSVPYHMQVRDCCRDGSIAAVGQDPANSVSSFALTVGYSGNSKVTIQPPRKLTLKAPGPGYTCSDLKKVMATKFPTRDGKRFTQAYVSWNATCTYTEDTTQNAIRLK